MKNASRNVSGRVAWLTPPLRVRFQLRWCVVLGVLLGLPAVGPALGLDDYVLGLVARGEPRAPGLEQGRFDLFTFASGDPARNRHLIELGLMLPWWSDPVLQLRFFRPLTSLLHRVDFLVWPETPELMYLHSLTWWAAALAAVTSLYAQLIPRRFEAAMAAFLFAVNDAIGAAVSWISNRSVVVGLLFGTLALRAHHRARGAARAISPAAVLWLALSLAAGEIGLWALAYLSAHALVDPLFSPRAFLESLPPRALALIGGVLGPLPSDFVFLARSDRVPWLLAIAALSLTVAMAAGLHALRSERMSRFWALGAVLSLLPVTASFPGDRLLLPANVGAMALVARALCGALSLGRRRLGGFRHAVALTTFALHGVLAPLALPFRARRMQWLSQTISDSFSSLTGVSDIAQKTLVVIGGPADFWVGYLQAELAWQRKPAPREVVWLTTGESDLSVSVRERSLTFVRADADGGFFQSATERLYRSEQSPLARGQVVRLPALLSRVDELSPSGSPSRITFEFPESLASDRYVVRVWGGQSYEVAASHALAELTSVPATSVWQAVARHEVLDCDGAVP